MSALAYKLIDRAEWREAAAEGAYLGSEIDRADGFIHLSDAAQVAGTALRHYSGRQNLLLLAVDLDAVADVRWEASRGGARFPHIYGPLPVAAVRSERPLSVGPDGTLNFEDGGPGWPA